MHIFCLGYAGRPFKWHTSQCFIPPAFIVPHFLRMAGGGKKPDDTQASAAAAASGPGFPVGATLVARWMGQMERTCVVIDRSEWPAD